MDQHEWGLFRETVGYRNQSAVLGADTEDATQVELLAAIGQPQHPRTEVAGLSSAARRSRVDLIPQRAREPQQTSEPDGTGQRAADGVVDQGLANWVAAPLTELPPTTREMADLVGSTSTTTAAPSAIGRATGLSRSLGSPLSRVRKGARRMGAAVPPMSAVLGVMRSHPLVASAALAVTVPMAVAALVLLPPSGSQVNQADSAGQGTALPLPITTVPQPRSAGQPTPELVPEDQLARPTADSEQATPTQDPPSAGSGGDAAGSGAPPAADNASRSAGSAAPSSSASGSSSADSPPAGSSSSDPAPEGRTTPPEECAPDAPMVGRIGCALAGLFGQTTGVFGDLRGLPIPVS